MTRCKNCGTNLEGKKLRSEYDETLLGFLRGRAKPNDPIPKKGDPKYTEKIWFLICDCNRKIPVTPKQIREGSEKYDEL